MAQTDFVQSSTAQTDTTASETSLPDLIAQLVPPPVPEAVSLWPQTPLAKSLLALLLILTLAVIWQAVRRYRANAYRRAALKALGNANDDPAQIAELLRRTALAIYPRQNVAGLTGEDWLAFLNRQYPGNAFHGALGEALLRGAYRQCRPNTDLTAAARSWIRRHYATLVPTEQDMTTASPEAEA